MAFLNFEYKMVIRYSEPVNKCYFTIKSIPASDFRQRCISYEPTFTPTTGYSESKDSFGNIQFIGNEGMPHSEFVFRIKGLVETQASNIGGAVTTSRLGMYKYEHGKCMIGPLLKAFASEIEKDVNSCGDILSKSRCIMDYLHRTMEYVPGSTTTETTAEEAFAMGQGVCQDYVHIYITLLRYFKIPARYVCGLIVGEGESHAWVEVANEGTFVAFDPTYNKAITEDYIKLGVGRDAYDCAINRGVMWGGGEQTQEVTVKVLKVYA